MGFAPPAPAPAAAGAWELIEKKAPGINVSSVTFSSIPTFDALMLVCWVHLTVDGSYLGLRFNGDMGNNYAFTLKFKSGPSAEGVFHSVGASLALVARWQLHTLGFIAPTLTTVWINNKVGQVTGYSSAGGSDRGEVLYFLGGFHWMGVPPVTSITLLPDSGQISGSSVFVLYGLRT